MIARATGSARWLVVPALALVLLGIVFAEPLVRLLAAEGYTADAGKFTLTVHLAQIMLPSLAR